MRTDLSLGTDEHALFVPAINETFARFAASETSNAARSMPGDLAPADLNYLDPNNPLFHYHAGLHSAAFGAYETRPTIVTKRDRKKTIIIGDCGGYTKIGDALKEPITSFRPKSLAWQEQHCDVGLLLDIPTRAIDKKVKGFGSVQQCLDETIISTRFALDHRQNPNMKLLTVMQGRDRKEARYWQAAVAPFQKDFEGIALAGDTKLDLALWCERLIDMRDKGQLDRLMWIHVLGTAQPGVGAELTGLQRALRKHLNPAIRISYDSSLAFRIVQVNKQITTGIAYDRDEVKFLRYKFPDHWSGLDRNARFPFSSPIGDLATVGDFNPANAGSATGWDTTGMQMLSHHEVYKELVGLAEINRLAEAEVMTAGQSPWHIRKAWEGFDAIFSSQTPMAEIKRYRKYLSHYAGSSALEDDVR